MNRLLNKWRETPFSRTEKLSIIKMLILPKLIYGVNATPNKFPVGFLEGGEKTASKFVWEMQRAKNNINNLEKEQS